MAPKRASYTTAFKLTVIRFAEEHGNRRAGRQFLVPESNVRQWRNDKITLLNTPIHKRSLRYRKCFWPQLEKRLRQWYLDERSKGNIWSSTRVRQQAELFAKEMNIEQFMASASWCERFMQREGLRNTFLPVSVELKVQDTDHNCAEIKEDKLTTEYRVQSDDSKEVSGKNRNKESTEMIQKQSEDCESEVFQVLNLSKSAASK
ncbi:Pogo transposable element with KRAB-like protein [Dinothrombium tinctorium]|uniref:Pogo transposable element with KRAB-like protein n=1 Tax=Dinothrombium tinctorium TaxID=1965070 RepID=A0A3S3PP40_9ACAR|nr:Pogo transposable element with KRAB-like protein [Dinothrombium tinctorium]